MEILAVTNYQDLSKKAADIIISQVKNKPNSILGLATGGTVLGTYGCLIDDHKENHTSYKQVHTVNLDEYVGMPQHDQNSYHYYMMDNIFSHIDVDTSNIHIPNGLAADYEAECENYEKVIEDLGGVDMQLLGIGVNGHIGFNEPGTSFQSKTHMVELTPSTRIANQRFFNSLDEVPTHAITMGISTIMKSKKILLLVSGNKKAKILKELIDGDINESIPASVLKNHPNVTIIADEEALSYLNGNKGKVLIK